MAPIWMTTKEKLEKLRADLQLHEFVDEDHVAVDEMGNHSVTPLDHADEQRFQGFDEHFHVESLCFLDQCARNARGVVDNALETARAKRRRAVLRAAQRAATMPSRYGTMPAIRYANLR